MMLAMLLAAQGVAKAGTPASTTGPLAALEHGLRPALLAANEPLPRWSLAERMAHYHVPGVAIAVIRDGRIVHTAGFGVREAGSVDPVDADTLFSVGSVSKMLTATTTLRLVARGDLALDRDVGGYLQSWSLPPPKNAGQAPVTLRMLLSHTAGLGVWGFKDYLPGEPLPTLRQTLRGEAPAKNEAVDWIASPGSRMRYSGGGYTVVQQILQDAARRPLERLARREVFDPLRMPRSTFTNPLPATRGNMAKAHDRNGARAALPRGWESFPEQAASGLWSSANELGNLVAALIGSYRGQSDFLPQSLAWQMMSPVSPSLHGLGPRLEGAGATLHFHHGGSNDSYHAWIEGHLVSGNGLVILTNGAGGGRLREEIRNALNDAMGAGVNPIVRTMPIASNHPLLADYLGTYRADPAMPSDLQGTLRGYFESDELQVRRGDSTLTLVDPVEKTTFPLHALTPTRFVMPGESHRAEIEFHRDGQGRITLMTVERPSGRLYFRREVD